MADTDRSLCDGFMELAAGMVGERHRNYFFNKGEKMVLSLDGMYTAAEIGRLHGYMRDVWRVRTAETMQEPVVVGGELRVELGDVIVIVTARPRP